MRCRRIPKGIAIERGASGATYPDRWSVLSVGRFWVGFHLRRLTHRGTVVVQFCAGPILYTAVRPPQEELTGRQRFPLRPDW
jgi:hypothetical protein